jgi:hypothetical protein
MATAPGGWVRYAMIDIRIVHLGHFELQLCRVRHRQPDSDKTFGRTALEHHSPLIEMLAAMNSWKARELLGIPREQTITPATELDLANRFFFGDIAMLNALRTGYAGLV